MLPRLELLPRPEYPLNSCRTDPRAGIDLMDRDNGKEMHIRVFPLLYKGQISSSVWAGKKQSGKKCTYQTKWFAFATLTRTSRIDILGVEKTLLLVQVIATTKLEQFVFLNAAYWAAARGAFESRLDSTDWMWLRIIQVHIVSEIFHEQCKSEAGT